MVRPIVTGPISTGRRVTTLVAAFALAVAPVGCATQGGFRPSVAENSSQSGDSSKGSGDSSGKSGDSSEKSGDSSQDSKGSSDSKSESKSDSSENSSEGSSGAVAVGAGVLLLVGVVFLVVTVSQETRAEPARAYLESHRRPIRVSLARGSGVFVDDVASALELPADQVDLLGRTLHAHRETLDGWLRDPEITTADLEGFSADLAAALASEPRLTPHVAATRERLQATFTR